MISFLYEDLVRKNKGGSTNILFIKNEVKPKLLQFENLTRDKFKKARTRNLRILTIDTSGLDLSKIRIDIEFFDWTGGLGEELIRDVKDAISSNSLIVYYLKDISPSSISFDKDLKLPGHMGKPLELNKPN